MIETLKKLLLDKFEYELKEHAIFEISREKNKIIPFTGGLFVVAVIFFILDTTSIFENFMNPAILFFLLVVLVIVPLAFQKGSKYNAIVVTKKYLIQRIGKKEFVVVDYDEITDFEVANEGVIIKEHKHKIILGMGLFREEIESIVEILEAKGKTFEKEKEFMIRPINIIIADNKVSIEDNEDVTSTEKLYQKYHKKYPMLTPGFVDEVLFRNSMIEDARIDGGSLILTLDGFQVKGGHPENTTFEMLEAVDCVLIFEKVVFEKALLKDLNKQTPDKELKLSVRVIPRHLKKGVISQWKSKGNKMEMVFATGVYQLNTIFTFDEVIVGWKDSK